VARRAAFGRFWVVTLLPMGFLGRSKVRPAPSHCCKGRALLFAQDRRWTGLVVIFVIALVDFTPDQQL
jgi:hypothetical protein